MRYKGRVAPKCEKARSAEIFVAVCVGATLVVALRFVITHLHPGAA
jgi:hypothetical protein